jgi:uncharacterized protein
VVVFLGLGGIVIPILPGLTLQVAAVMVWALAEGSPMGWVVAGVSVVVAAVATVLKYTRPGRRLKEAGVPTRVLAVAVVAAIVGFFVLPVVGVVLGFVLALYVFERARVGREHAWPSTKTALIAIAQSIGIELAGGLLILILFTAAVFLI